MSNDNGTESSREWTKFGILVIVLIGTVLVVSSSRTFLFEHIIPIVMGDRETLAPSPVELTPPVLEVPETAYPGEQEAVQEAAPAYPAEPEAQEPEAEEVAAPEAVAPEAVAPETVGPVDQSEAPVVELETAPSYPGPETTSAEAESAGSEATSPDIQGAASFGTATTSAGAPIIYIVRTGDTLIGIAEKHNVTVSELVAANGLVNPNRIKIGDSLTIPAP